MNWNQREKKDPQHQASTDSKVKQPLMSQEENFIEKVLSEGLTEEHLTTLHLPSTDVTPLQRMKLYKPQQQKGSTQTLHQLPSLLNIGYVSNETNTDVRMYIEEFILVEIWIHYCTK